MRGAVIRPSGGRNTGDEGGNTHGGAGSCRRGEKVAAGKADGDTGQDNEGNDLKGGNNVQQFAAALYGANVNKHEEQDESRSNKLTDQRAMMCKIGEIAGDGKGHGREPGRVGSNEIEPAGDER